jgi:hypothetical protein
VIYLNKLLPYQFTGRGRPYRGDLTHQLFFLGFAKDNVYVPTLLPELEVLKTGIMEACSRADDDRLRQT